MKNNFCVQSYATGHGEWWDSEAFQTIVEAVNYYKWVRSEMPNIEHRIIQILEVEE